MGKHGDVEWLYGMLGIVKKPVISIYEGPYTEKLSKEGQRISAIADEGLYGMLLQAIGEETAGFLPIRTFYGYTGYVKPEDVRLVSVSEGKAWDGADLMVVGGSFVDVLSVPRVQGTRLMSLVRGCLVQVLEWESEVEGWAKVGLVDGSAGYVRNQFLWKKEFSQEGVWENRLPQKHVDEKDFRNEVVDRALSYLGVQYRWGGRSTAGIDCSGLTFVSYLMSGILIYRDARIAEGYPVHEIDVRGMKKGDLLYFPGHIAMALGEGRYIHSTGKTGSGGVVINSLNPEDDDYRKDLADTLNAVGSIF